MPTADQVADKAAAYARSGTYWGVGYCLRFSRICAGAPAGTYNAITAWREANYRHTTGVPPRGSFVYWSGGGAGHGHIAVSDGGGYVWSTDILRSGKVDRVSIAYVGAKWRNLDGPLGWSEDVNGVKVSGFTYSASGGATVRLANLKPGLRNSDVTDLQKALVAHGYGSFTPTGYFGDLTRAAVAKAQRAFGFTGSDADGVPGPTSCARLGLTVTT